MGIFDKVKTGNFTKTRLSTSQARLLYGVIYLLQIRPVASTENVLNVSQPIYNTQTCDPPVTRALPGKEQHGTLAISPVLRGGHDIEVRGYWAFVDLP
jgi:hypothetical protein